MLPWQQLSAVAINIWLVIEHNCIFPIVLKCAVKKEKKRSSLTVAIDSAASCNENLRCVRKCHIVEHVSVF